MPRSKSTNGKTEKQDISARQRFACASDAAWGGFLNVRLTDEQKAQFDEWRASVGAQFWSSLADIVAEGMKLSLVYDAENECFVATFTGALTGSPKFREASSSRAGTWEEAVALMVFKHEVLAVNGWGDFRPKSKTFMSWG